MGANSAEAIEFSGGGGAAVLDRRLSLHLLAPALAVRAGSIIVKVVAEASELHGNTNLGLGISQSYELNSPPEPQVKAGEYEHKTEESDGAEHVPEASISKPDSLESGQRKFTKERAVIDQLAMRPWVGGGGGRRAREKAERTCKGCSGEKSLTELGKPVCGHCAAKPSSQGAVSKASEQNQHHKRGDTHKRHLKLKPRLRGETHGERHTTKTGLGKTALAYN